VENVYIAELHIFHRSCRHQHNSTVNTVNHNPTIFFIIIIKKLWDCDLQCLQYCCVDVYMTRSGLPPKSNGFLHGSCATFPPIFVKISRVVVLRDAAN